MLKLDLLHNRNQCEKDRDSDRETERQRFGEIEKRKAKLFTANTN